MRTDNKMKGSNNRIKSDLGVSETVGFIIIFGITITGIAIVTVYGYPALLNAQADANIRNMERNLIVLQSDVNSLVYKSVPYKETTMQVSGGVLSVETPNSADKWFTLFDSTDSVHLIPNDYSHDNKFLPGYLKFLSDSTNIIISLQNGAIVKRQAGGSVMISEPRWFTDEYYDGANIFKTLVITLIQVDTFPPGQNLGKSGIGTVQMTVEPLIIDIPNNDNMLEYQFAQPGHDIIIEYRDLNFDYKTAWKNFFVHGTLHMDDAGEYAGSLSEIDRVIIKAWKINILNL